ncbi:hypothetical protein FOZ60_017377 [Perkinsus olseni]|uniref:Uncharacterized protein n=1 Tax=Perkinsus olseni TaxID=32597 RepID=A0A7J6P2L4_PEROL|nr:hypothetical protein FOZ60_017377 [Perkinsus olseni]
MPNILLIAASLLSILHFAQGQICSGCLYGHYDFLSNTTDFAPVVALDFRLNRRGVCRVKFTLKKPGAEDAEFLASYSIGIGGLSSLDDLFLRSVQEIPDAYRDDFNELMNPRLTLKELIFIKDRKIVSMYWKGGTSRYGFSGPTPL